MNDSLVAKLRESEREALRALWRRGAVNLIPAELGRSHNTVKVQLAKARSKLKAATSMDAARILAEAEASHPSGVYPEWAIAPDHLINKLERADPDLQLLRDGSDWSYEPGPEKPGASRRDQAKNAFKQVLLVIQVATAFIGFLAALSYVMNSTSLHVPWDAFQP